MSVESLELGELAADETKGKAVVENYMDLLKSVKVNVEVIVGGAEIGVSDLLSLKENSIITLDKDLAAPLEIRLEGKVIARGKLAAADDNFAIQITEVSNSVKNYSAS